MITKTQTFGEIACNFTEYLGFGSLSIPLHQGLTSLANIYRTFGTFTLTSLFQHISVNKTD